MGEFFLPGKKNWNWPVVIFHIYNTARFLKGTSTIQRVFIRNSLVNNRIRRKRKKLYVRFIDAKAAFDNIIREILFENL